jgi:hypothetical protein
VLEAEPRSKPAAARDFRNHYVGEVLADPARRDGEAVTHRICRGTFRTSGRGLVKVWIIARGYDADCRLAEVSGRASKSVPLRSTPLSADGVLYYEEGETTPYRTVAEARRAADRRAYGPLTWQEPPGNAPIRRLGSTLVDRLDRLCASLATGARPKKPGAKPAIGTP